MERRNPLDPTGRGYEPPDYEYPVEGVAWTAGVGRPAGIYWLDDRCIIAGHGSPAESWLLERRALLIATLRFEAEPYERHHPGRAVRAAPALEVLAALGR